MSIEASNSGNEVLCFVHVAKCAGNTVEDHFLKNLPASQVMRPEKSKPIV